MELRCQNWAATDMTTLASDHIFHWTWPPGPPCHKSTEPWEGIRRTNSM